MTLSFRKSNLGFTLIEMAVVLVIMGLMLGGLIAPFSIQMEQRNLVATRATLENAKEALIGFAMTNGRFPCPATAASNGAESPAGGGACTTNYNGFLPAATLGLSGTDNNGYLLDAYGGTAVNRIRYAVSNANGNAFTTTSGMRTTTMAGLQPNLYICVSATGVTATSCGATASNYLTGTSAGAPNNGVPAMIYSLGKNAPYGGNAANGAIDESANPNPNSANNDSVFVSHAPAPSTAGNGEFDDVVTWISSSILYSRMVQAGQLP